MAARIKVLDKNLKPLGSTSKAFNVEKTQELMREYTLGFSVVNNDSVFEHISENSTFLYEGQYFDVAGIDGDSGSNNVTQITAEHVSYRMADYTIPNNYSFTGTAKQIATDILAEAKTVDGVPANKVFDIGECIDIGTVTFALKGTNITAREALIGMSKLGLEINFDNFIVNLPKRIGSDNGVSFEYGNNLDGVHRTWQKGNGWSYDVKIADLQKVPGNESKTFSLGDTITVSDTLSKFTLTKQIISYTECDDPSQNKITIGVFIRDSASFSIETEHLAMTANATANDAKNTADNSVQQGEKYSNVKITHEDGFEATNKADTQRVIMNSDDCFAVQIKKNGEWVTVNSLEAFGLLVDRLTSLEAKENFHVKVGTIDNSHYGLVFITKGDKTGYLGASSNTYITPNGDTVHSTGLGIRSNSSLGIVAEKGPIKIQSEECDDSTSMITFEAVNLEFITSNLIVQDPRTGQWARGYTGDVEFKEYFNETNYKNFKLSFLHGILTNVDERWVYTGE